MKKLLALFIATITASTLIAQTSQTTQATPDSCGPFNVTYKVESATSDASIPAPASGNATLVFIEDEVQDRPGHEACLKCSTRVQLGMDGEWIAAAKGFSHTSVSIAPGDHHFCAWGTAPALATSPLRSYYELHVEAGKTYFLRGHLAFFGIARVSDLNLALTNEDEGRYLVLMSKQSTFTKK